MIIDHQSSILHPLSSILTLYRFFFCVSLTLVTGTA
jgi:hypothetical protein